jgi:hypothetical protein
MPWKGCNPMDERLKFIARLLDGEKMAGLRCKLRPSMTENDESVTHVSPV